MNIPSKVLGIKDLRLLFPSYRVEEGETDFEIPVTEFAVSCATPNDPSNCALSVAARFTHPGNLSVCVWRSTAYVINHDHHTMTHQMVDAYTRGMVDHYDKTGRFLPGLYALRAPSKTQRLDHKPTGRRTTGTGRTNRRMQQPTRLGCESSALLPGI